MAFIGGKQLKSFLIRNKIITDENGINIFDANKIEQAAYKLSLGSEVYRTDNKDKKTEFLDEKNRYVDINPGQFCLLMTDEFVSIPADKLAFISIKAKQKLKGLINVSGFHVDPGFYGKLTFSVYNAGPSIITLELKKAYFLIWFANFEQALDSEYLYSNENNHHQGQSTLNPEYLSALKKDEMTSPHALLQRIKDVDAEFTKKIDEKNRKLLNNEYLLKLLIGLSIALLLRVLFINYDEKANSFRFNEVNSKIDSVSKENHRLKKTVNILKNNNLPLSNPEKR